MIVLLLVAVPACAQGRAQVHDGDTLYLDGQAIRLWGIDAAELEQDCEGRPCGVMARDALAGIVDGRDVACKAYGRSYRRVVAKCHAGQIDLGREMVRLGMAREYRRFSRGAYAVEERAARRGRIGLWAWRMDNPAQWRAAHPSTRRWTQGDRRG